MQGLDIGILMILVICPVFLLKVNMHWVSTTPATRVQMQVLATRVHPCYGHLVHRWGLVHGWARKEQVNSSILVRKYTHFVVEKARVVLKLFSFWKWKAVLGCTFHLNVLLNVYVLSAHFKRGVLFLANIHCVFKHPVIVQWVKHFVWNSVSLHPSPFLFMCVLLLRLLTIWNCLILYTPHCLLRSLEIRYLTFCQWLNIKSFHSIFGPRDHLMRRLSCQREVELKKLLKFKSWAIFLGPGQGGRCKSREERSWANESPLQDFQ